MRLVRHFFVRPARFALAVCVALSACAKHKAETFRTDTSDRGGISEQVSATGEVEAIVSVNVGSQVSGTITKIYVDFNSMVKKDQVLCDLDPRLFKAALASAEAGLAAANANVAKAQAALDDSARQEKRTRALIAQNLIAQADVDTAMATREQNAAALLGMKAAVLQQRANRDSAAANLVFTHIVSPIDGVVVSRAVDVGVTVAAAMNVATLFTIANDLTKMQILANIDEADVGKVKEGLIAKFSVDAWPNETFQGRIREVRQSPTTINNVVTYAAVIEAPNPDRKLKPGMTASVQITTAHRDDVIRVPNAALRFKPSTPVASSGNGADPADAKGSAPAREGSPQQVAGDHPHRHHGDGGTPDAAMANGASPSTDGTGADAPKPQGRRGKVYELVDGKPVVKLVRLGLQDSSHTEVLEGIGENEPVIVAEIGGAGGPAQQNSLMGGVRPPGGGGGRR
jgi:HlyD family secretion protein